MEMPVRELERWRRYWDEEPWGPRRDNMHAAMLARQMLVAAGVKDTDLPKLSNFMFETGEEREQREDLRRRAVEVKFKALARMAARKKGKRKP